MVTYILRRLLLMIPTLIGVTAVVFFTMALSPGGFGAAKLNEMDAQMQGEDAKRVRQYMMRRYGLDKPVIVQYGRWMNQVSPLGFRMSAEVVLSEEELADATEVLEEGIDWQPNRLRNALNTIENIAPYAGLGAEDVAKQIRDALDDPVDGVSLFDLMDAEVDKALIKRLEELAERDLTYAREEFLERLAFEAEGRSRILFTHPKIDYPDLGNDLNDRPVVDVLKETLPITLLLNLITLPLIYVIAIVSGIYAARHRGKFFDIASGTTMLGLWSIPTIWAGAMLITFVCSVEYLRLFPTGGLHSLDADSMPFLPTFSGAVGSLGYLGYLLLLILLVGGPVTTVLASLSILSQVGAQVRTSRQVGFALTHVIGSVLFVWGALSVARWPEALMAISPSAAVLIGSGTLLLVVSLTIALTQSRSSANRGLTSAATTGLVGVAVFVAAWIVVAKTGVPTELPEQRGYLIDWIWHLTLPVLCLTYGGFAFLSKLMRGSVIENLSADYVRTARAKGVADRDVLFRHVFRNSLLPLITVAASLLPALLVGSVVVEKIFEINGMGRLSIEAAFQKDRELMMAIVLIGSLITLTSQIIRDVCYAIADPRVTYE